MTIQLELNPEIVAKLRSEAKVRGIGLEEYAESILREAIGPHSAPRNTLSVEDLRQMLATIAEGAKKLPKLPTSSFTRESFYKERH
jgi:hypothetical protein